MYVCMYVCMYACMYVCICACNLNCVQAYTSARPVVVFWAVNFVAP